MCAWVQRQKVDYRPAFCPSQIEWAALMHSLQKTKPPISTNTRTSRPFFRHERQRTTTAGGSTCFSLKAASNRGAARFDFGTVAHYPTVRSNLSFTSRSKRGMQSSTSSMFCGFGAFAMSTPPDLPPHVHAALKQRGDDLGLYCDYMRLIKRRTDLLARLLQDRPANIPEFAIGELCVLQLRMICELIALACLAVHREAPGARSDGLPDDTRAVKILNRLETLHPGFYPHPFEPQGISRVPIQSGYLTKLELKHLWRRCSDYLHEGTLNEPTVSKTPVQAPEVAEAHNKIISLLSNHWIQMCEPMWTVTIRMQGENGQVNGTMDFAAQIGAPHSPTASST